MQIGLARIGVALATLCVAAGSAAWAQEVPRSDRDRLAARLEALSAFGANADGGIDRVAYSDADIQARAWVMEEMRRLGLENVRIDAGGNILGRRPGASRRAKPIMFGSHVDSVRGGGNYDGQVGVVTALEAISVLNAANIRTRSPLDVVVFSNEEGGLIGSLAMTGRLGPEALEVESDAGMSIRDGIRRIGGDPDALENAIVRQGVLKAFIELHIEQGAILHAEDIDIGVVEGIVGIEWWNVSVEGRANHAGTTPMNRRNDALLAAARMVIAINETALAIEGAHVATVGRIRALPGAPNVIPGRAEFSLEVRDLSSEKMREVYAAIEARLRAIAAERAVTLTLERLDVASHPALTDPAIRSHIAAAAQELGLSHRRMPSGAGHDAQDMARIAPTGMIFVPSVDGVSHSPRERSEIADIANGADVLVRTILRIDAE